MNFRDIRYEEQAIIFGSNTITTKNGKEYHR